jgi:iron-sulfur cluster repair protein YtfE (RIC family)
MSTTTTTAARPNTGEMVVVHNCFRREFGNLPGLIRAVPAGDTARAEVVVGHLLELSRGLHHHHTGEDELMWPLLLERATTDRALILRMEEQHERIAELEGRTSELARAFAPSADPAAGRLLAETLTLLNDALDEHMAEEERHVLPLVEQVMTVEEWTALGERGRAGMPKDRQLVQLGFLLLGTTPEQRRDFLAELPLPARIAWRLLGRRAFVTEYTRLYGRAPAL